jgi:hypothetical protein
MKRTEFGSLVHETQRRMSVKHMKKANKGQSTDEMRSEYDFSKGVRGKYYQRYRQGTNLVLLEPDLAKVFLDSEAVNIALRQFLAEHGEPPRSSKQNAG